MADHPVPKTQIETLKEIIEGYYKAADVGEIVDDEDVSTEIGLSADVIKRQKKFLADIGFLDKDGYDYTLLEPGHAIGHALAYDRDSDAAQTAEELLENWEVTEQLEEDIGSETRTEEEVLQSFAYLTETDISSSRKRTGLSALIELYVWTDILSETSDGKYHLSNSAAEEENQDSGQQDTTTEPEENGDSPPDQPFQRFSDTSNDILQLSPNNSGVETIQTPGTISFQFELSGDEDPENVKNLVLAIREGLQEEIDSEETGANGISADNQSTIDSISN